MLGFIGTFVLVILLIIAAGSERAESIAELLHK
ncbi:hypothetical protein PATA110616_12580 [Paenibacillus tarimensis]